MIKKLFLKNNIEGEQIDQKFILNIRQKIYNEINILI